MNTYTLEEIIEMLKRKSEQPFYGKTEQVWENGKIVLWREVMSKKPSGTTEGKRRLSDEMESQSS